MARTKIPVEFSSTPGIVDNSSATAITIDSAGAATFSGAVTADGFTTNTAKLKATAKDISDTAVDVFVYDTRKDSDGGAWRKRTQNTSWYNETLNTSTRGARKEFPSVAVIVAEVDTVTIYDGDDPDMPMWMVFNKGGGWTASSNLIATTASAVKASQAVNATLVVAISDGYGMMSINFISELTHSIQFNVDFPYLGNIALRNSGSGYGGSYSTNYILGGTVNDIAMTVLPNAPIDADTGLPVPTIAVATNGGVSVIKDDGSVVDITVNNASYTHAHKVDFLKDNSLGMSIGVANGLAQESYYIFNSIPTTDNVITVDNIAGTTQNVDEFYAIQAVNPAVDLQLLGLDTNRKLSASTGNIFGSNEGLSIIDRKVGAPDKGLISYIASDYNTGWMVGDIKLATLSDTDATNVTGSELVTNGTFAGNLSGWTLTGDVTPTYDSGTGGAKMQTAVSVDGAIYQAITATADVVVTWEVDANTSGFFGLVLNGTLVKDNITASGSYSTTSTISSIQFAHRGGGGGYGIIDNISVRKAEVDRSVNGKGLQVFGTVTKTAVATGADLVGYSGFSVGKYLAQPYNSDLAYGTGDFCYTLWIKKTGTAFGYIFDRANGDGTQRVTSYFNNGATISSYTNNGAINDVAIPNGSWFQLVQLRVNGTMKVYINGVLKGSVGTSTNLSGDSNVPLKIGVRFNLVDGLTDGSISLFRSSATAPTPEQIKKIYNDEKHLFTTNAQATLYGTSDAVTALAYDEDTELLHVGTSAGRSVFQGLNRVDNTTDAVGTAISASNGLVAED